LSSSTEFTVPLEAGATTALAYRADPSTATLLLGHGAGAGQRHPFMVAFAQGLSGLGIDVITFNFPYTEQRRRRPDPGPVLEACYRRVVAAAAARADRRLPLFIGGKSMGGRIATQIAAADRELPIAGLVLLGYPLHPPGRPDQRRDRHLPSISVPMLFVQGSKDAFGTPAELAPALASIEPAPAIHVVEGGDHSFTRSKKDAAVQAALYDEIQRRIAQWIGGISGRPAGAA
jgi:predicted alpha/beta-hydrolase family hydrolase